MASRKRHTFFRRQSASAQNALFSESLGLVIFDAVFPEGIRKKGPVPVRYGRALAPNDWSNGPGGYLPVAAPQTVSKMSRVTTYGSQLALGRRSSM